MTTLSVVIPVYDEKDYILAVLQRVQGVDLSGLTLEMVIVDDASRDGTREILRDLAAQREVNPHGVATINGTSLRLAPLKIVFQEVNQGKGAALRRGFGETTGDIVLVQDADFEYDPTEYPKLLAPILAGKADVVFGSRFVGGDAHRVLYYWHSVGNRLLTLTSNLFTNLNLSDMECCYKVFRREILQLLTIEENRFGIEPEITAKVARLHCRIYEVGVSYAGRTYAEGKKIGWRDGFRAIWCILKYNILR